tara:strand:- start:19 stop:900 length:882 start_codon:yes stop_codon:yes gene_type:complete
MNIKILLGGDSSEKDVSIKSGEAVYKAIKDKYNVDLIFLNEDYSCLKDILKKNDIVFNALHGGYGEDGTLQSFLDGLNIKYTGSKADSCKKAISKHKAKLIAKKHNIQTPEWILVDSKLKFKDSINFDPKYVVKADDQGSTLGLYMVDTFENAKKAYEKVMKISKRVIIEKYISGREITVGILNGEVLPIVEIIPNNNFYDYQAKYSDHRTKYICPAKINVELEKKIKNDAMKIFNLLKCKDYARVDFRLDNNISYFLEINTHPGLTSKSLFPMAAKQKGISFSQLIKKIIKI